MTDTIFLVVAKYCYDYDTTTDRYAFHTLDSAKRKYATLTANALKEAEENQFIVEQNEVCFSAYEIGSYAENHIDICIDEIPVK